MRKESGLLFTLALLIAPSPLVAQDVRVQVATQEPPYYAGEPVVVQFTVEGFDEQPEPTCEMQLEKPAPSLRGQMAGTTPSVFSQIIQRNGQLYQAKSITYRIDYLVTADQPGEYTVGPFAIKQGRKDSRVESLKMTFQEVPANPNMRVRLLLPDKPLYPDQRVPVRIEWWYAGDFDDVLKLRIYSPLFDQFRFAPDPQPQRGASRLPIDTKDGSLGLTAETREEELDGKRFPVVTATRTLIPDRVGEFALTPIAATARKVTEWARDRSPFGDLDSGFGGSLFRDLMGDRRRPASTELVRALGEPQKVIVNPFPLESRPLPVACQICWPQTPRQKQNSHDKRDIRLQRSNSRSGCHGPSHTGSSSVAKAPSRASRPDLRRGHVAGVVAAANERPAGDLQKAHAARRPTQFREFFGRQVTGHGQQAAAVGLEVLAQRQEVHLPVAQVGQHVQDLLLSLADTQHQPALGFDRRVQSLDALQQFQRPAIIRFGPAQAAVQSRHRLGVMIEDVGGCGGNSLQCLWATDEVGRQYLDARPGSLADRQHALAEVIGAAIRQIIPRDRGNDDVPQAQPRSRLRDSPRFIRIGRLGFAPRHRAETAGTGADVAQNHEGGGPLRVALHAVRATGVVADRLQVQFVH